jgi:hypothetical protein
MWGYAGGIGYGSRTIESGTGPPTPLPLCPPEPRRASGWMRGWRLAVANPGGVSLEVSHSSDSRRRCSKAPRRPKRRHSRYRRRHSRSRSAGRWRQQRSSAGLVRLTPPALADRNRRSDRVASSDALLFALVFRDRLPREHICRALGDSERHDPERRPGTGSKVPLYVESATNRRRSSLSREAEAKLGQQDRGHHSNATASGPAKYLHAACRAKTSIWC